MEAPKPRAGPFIATTMGFLKWMNADTKSLKNHGDDVTTRRKRSGCVRGAEVRFLITWLRLQCGCSLSCGQWSGGPSGTTAPGRYRKPSPRSWATTACCHQQPRYSELGTLPSWSEEKGEVSMAGCNCNSPHHHTHAHTQLKRIQMIQSSSIKGLNGKKEMEYCHWLFSIKDIQKANPPKLLSQQKTKSKLSELFYKLAVYRLTAAHWRVLSA